MANQIQYFKFALLSDKGLTVFNQGTKWRIDLTRFNSDILKWLHMCTVCEIPVLAFQSDSISSNLIFLFLYPISLSNAT